MRIFRKLAQMLDVNVAGVSDGDALVWDDGTGKWVPGSGGGGGGGGSDDQTAAEVPFTPAGTIAATDTQSAVEEVAADAAAAVSALSSVYQPLDSELTAIAALSTTSFGRGLLGLADAAALRAAVDLEPGTDIPSLAAFDDHSARHEDGGADEISLAGLSGTSAALQAHLDDTADAHAASAITNTPAGNVAATTVQAAINELDSEKTTAAAALAAAQTEIADQKRVVEILVTDPNGDALTTGDGKAYFRVPSLLNGHNLVAVAASVSTVSSSGTPTIQIRNATQTADMLSTRITIDVSEKDSKDATTAAVIDTGNDDVATGDQIFIDVDVAGTGTKGLLVSMTFEAP